MRLVDTIKVDLDGGRLMELTQPLAGCGVSFNISLTDLVSAFAVSQLNVCSVPLL
jgi:hypothetical protein